MGLVQEMDMAMQELKQRYKLDHPDPLYARLKLIRTCLDGIKSQIVGCSCQGTATMRRQVLAKNLNPDHK